MESRNSLKSLLGLCRLTTGLCRPLLMLVGTRGDGVASLRDFGGADLGLEEEEEEEEGVDRVDASMPAASVCVSV
jgi:hypothetical protein